MVNMYDGKYRGSQRRISRGQAVTSVFILRVLMQFFHKVSWLDMSSWLTGESWLVEGIPGRIASWLRLRRLFFVGVLEGWFWTGGSL